MLPASASQTRKKNKKQAWLRGNIACERAGFTWVWALRLERVVVVFAHCLVVLLTYNKMNWTELESLS